MQEMQETQNILDILTKKCSRCKKEQVICNFGFKKNEDEFKTCKRCRKQPIIDNNRPGSSNDHLIVNTVIENPVIEKDDICKKDIPEITDTHKIAEIFNNDTDDMCIAKLIYIFLDFGYDVHPLNQQIIDILFRALDDPFKANGFIDTIIKNKDVGVLERDDRVDLLFAPDDKTVYLMNLKNTNLIDNYVSKIRYKNKKRCQICFEKQSKHFKICSQCDKEYCNECFTKTNQKYLCCPFCRYTMKSHISNNMKKFKEDESQIFKCILEAKEIYNFL